MERFRNAHSSDIDGVAPGAVGEFSRAVVQSLIDAGHLVPVDGSYVPSAPRDLEGDTVEAVTARFDRAWSEREAGYVRDLAARDARIASLSDDLAKAKRDLDDLLGAEKKD